MLQNVLIIQMKSKYGDIQFLMYAEDQVLEVPRTKFLISREAPRGRFERTFFNIFELFYYESTILIQFRLIFRKYSRFFDNSTFTKIET